MATSWPWSASSARQPTSTVGPDRNALGAPGSMDWEFCCTLQRFCVRNEAARASSSPARADVQPESVTAVLDLPADLPARKVAGTGVGRWYPVAGVHVDVGETVLDEVH